MTPDMFEFFSKQIKDGKFDPKDGKDPNELFKFATVPFLRKGLSPEQQEHLIMELGEHIRSLLQKT